MNSKCGVQSKRRCKSHESCVCIFGFSACGCQKKNVVYETECRHVAIERDKQDQESNEMSPGIHTCGECRYIITCLLEGHKKKSGQ